MPVINGAEYLNAALDSVLAQDYDDFEVICVNDGSTDGTLALLASFDDPRIRIISQVSQGVAAARNTGIHFARGQYIAFIDWHDRWLKNKLSSHIAHLDSSPRVGASYGPSLFIDKQGQLTGLGQFPRLYDTGLREVVCHNLVGNDSAAVVRRATLNKLNACSPVHESGRICYFDETLRDEVKLDFWLKIALYSGSKLEGVSIPTTHVRISTGKLSISLAEQYASWQHVMTKYRASHPARVSRWFSLAHAYQLRRLALNASQTGETRLAFAYLFKAVFTNWRMVAETPGKTLLVAASVCLSVLPKRVYRFFEARTRKRLAKKQLVYSDNVVSRVTVSVGATWRDSMDGQSLDEMIHEADMAMYSSKRAGKNRFTLAQPAVVGERKKWRCRPVMQGNFINSVTKNRAILPKHKV